MSRHIYWLLVELGLACLLASLSTQVAQGASIYYGDFVNAKMAYRNVTESSLTDAGPLYGMPQLVSDSLVFRPQNFGSYATGGAADVTEGLVSVTLEALSNAGIQSIGIQESGDYLLVGEAGAFAMAALAAPVNVRITEIDGQAVAGTMPQAQFLLDLFQGATPAPSDGIFSLDDEGAGGGLWSGSLDIDFNSIIQSAGLSGRATQIELSLGNLLSTSSSLGTAVDINKKDLALVLTMNTAVPEPATLMLLVFGSCGLALAGGGGWQKSKAGRR